MGRRRSSSAPDRPLQPQYQQQQQQQQQQQRPAAFRQSSIGINRMPVAQALRQAGLNPNASTNALQQGTGHLPTLEEEDQLNTSRHGSAGTTQTTEFPPTRLRKARSALHTKLSFWKGKDANADADLEKQQPMEPLNLAEPGMNYTSNMVDVLDTLGM
jgi:hypothetical protein